MLMSRPLIYGPIWPLLGRHAPFRLHATCNSHHSHIGTVSHFEYANDNIHLLTNLLDLVVMHGSILAVTIPPGNLRDKVGPFGPGVGNFSSSLVPGVGGGGK